MTKQARYATGPVPLKAGRKPHNTSAKKATLRRRGLIKRHGKSLEILDVEGLNAFSGFDPNYLHLNGWWNGGLQNQHQQGG